ncbi:peptidoglycan editing factor PgeF [Tepidiphilus sp. J10]|uniref:peptidoglycan editing factor PgeF n=1 Tax=Tepidiphilus sp. J10 TaxID=2502185 RepID=UPI00115CE635|nr:peptidoglycan editing factor PgeF [Tepidiphilus sp. J10]
MIRRIHWPEAPRNVVLRLTDREGGVSREPYASFNLATHVGDDPAAVVENRLRLARLLPAMPLWLEQVHGTRVFDADHEAWGETPPSADAAVTTKPGVPLAVLVADCLPVAFAACDGRRVAVAHAGWRGLAGGVLEVVARYFARGGFVAWIGPGISAAHYEVGEEVRRAFVDQAPSLARFFVPGRDGAHWHADLAGIARAKLLAAGAAAVRPSGRCTFRDETLYSYRRERGRTGRFALCLWRTSA